MASAFVSLTRGIIPACAGSTSLVFGLSLK